MKYSVIDLFAGAGGLSLGFEQTGKFEIKAAVENNPSYQKTYLNNHPKVKMYDDACSVNYGDINKTFGDIDVVIGGPPCQGFSNANRQKTQAISQNNMLVKQYVRAVIELHPKAFVMENVSMLKSGINRFYLETDDVDIVAEFDIPCVDTSLILLDKALLFDGLVTIVRDRDLVSKLLWKNLQYSTLNVIYKKHNNATKLAAILEKRKLSILRHVKLVISSDTGNKELNSIYHAMNDAFEQFYNKDIQIEQLIVAIKQPLMIQRMLKKLKEIFDNNIVVDRYDYNNGLCAHVRSFGVFDYINKILGSEKYGYVLKSDVLCAANFGVPQKRMRFVLMGIKKHINKSITLPKGHIKENNFKTVKDAISDIDDINPTFNVLEDKGLNLCDKPDISSLARQLRNSPLLFNHIVANTRETAITRFTSLKQGENFHDLDAKLKENTYSDASRTQNTIYVRLKYNEPSGTVVNVRKSMWIHPIHNRAISIREAARLQTFPDNFQFMGSKDQQYQQVGNAVPPILAHAIAESLLKALGNKKIVK